MSSILTNTAALTALQSLRQTQMALNDTQKQISTGLKISSASDNASTWSIAQTMQSDQGVLSTLSDSLNESSSMLNTASAAVNSAITVMNSIKSAVAQAQQPGADTAKIDTSLAQLGAQLKSLVSSAGFNGVNLLDGSQTTIKMVASYTDGGGTNASSIGTIDLTASALVNGGAGKLDHAQAASSLTATNFTTLSVTGLTSAQMTATLSNADQAISDLTTYASQIGAVQSRVTSQGAFIKALNDALTTGVSSLVDADMNQASTRLQALQTQQQLGVQSLSIANQNAQLILKLFQ